MAGDQPISVQMTQAKWLGDWYRYLIEQWASNCSDALDVGCGQGFVMETLGGLVNVQGIDISQQQVKGAIGRGLIATEGDAMDLRFDDDRFDLVYSSYYLMWVKDPSRALKEMVRVARKRVILMAEPLYSGSIVHPSDLNRLISSLREKVSDQGADPDVGIRIPGLLREIGLDHRFGTVPMETSLSEVKEEVEFEERYTGLRLDEGLEVDLFHIPSIWAVLSLQDDITLRQV